MADINEYISQNGSSSALRRRGSDSGYQSLASVISAFWSPDLLVFSNMAVPEDLSIRFAEIKLLYQEKVLKAITKRNGKRESALWKLRYMGLDESCARLHIIIQCEKNVARKVRRFFRQSHVKEELGQDFLVMVVGTSLEKLMNHTDNVEPRSATGSNLVFLRDEPRHTLCGTDIELRGDESTRSVTFGGLVKVTKPSGVVLYGLTAGHCLEDLAPPKPLDCSSLASESEDDTESETDEDSDDSEDCQDIDSGGYWKLPSRAPQVARSALAIAPHQSRQIGTMSRNSFTPSSTMSSRDWALIELNGHDLLPNSFSAASVPLPAWNGKFGNLPLTGAADKGVFLTRPKIDVVVLTRRGVQAGTLRCSSSSILVAPGRQFVDTLEFAPAPGSDLKFGDSGSWVVDPQNGSVYGHVVAIDIFGEAHVVPMNEILEEISEELQASHASLPSAQDIAAITSLAATPAAAPTSIPGRPRSRPDPTVPRSCSSVGHSLPGPPQSNRNVNLAEEVPSPKPKSYQGVDAWKEHRAFQDWAAEELKNHCGTRFSEDGPKDSPYIPLHRLNEYWTTERLEMLLQESMRHHQHTEVWSAEEIQTKFLRIFTTLAYISDTPGQSRIHHLGSFSKQGFDDTNLPFRDEGQLEGVLAGSWSSNADGRSFYASQFLFTPHSLGETVGGELPRTVRQTGLAEFEVLPLKFERRMTPAANEENDVELVLLSYLDFCGLTPPNSLILARIYPPEEHEYSFPNERETCTSVQSENLSAYLGSFVQCRRPVSLFEYADNGSLPQYFQENNNPIPRVVWVETSMAALSACASLILHCHPPITEYHSVHGNIEPENILLTWNRTEYSQNGFQLLGILDSNNAKIMTNERDLHHTQIPRVYGAPELMGSDPPLHNLYTADTQASDIWSLGCVLLEALLWTVGGERGRRQFITDRRAEITNEHARIPANSTAFHNAETSQRAKWRSVVYNTTLWDRICTYLLADKPSHSLNAEQALHFMRRLIDDAAKLPPAVSKQKAEHLPQHGTISTLHPSSSIRTPEGFGRSHLGASTVKPTRLPLLGLIRDGSSVGSYDIVGGTPAITGRPSAGSGYSGSNKQPEKEPNTTCIKKAVSDHCIILLYPQIFLIDDSWSVRSHWDTNPGGGRSRALSVEPPTWKLVARLENGFAFECMIRAHVHRLDEGAKTQYPNRDIADSWSCHHSFLRARFADALSELNGDWGDRDNDLEDRDDDSEDRDDDSEDRDDDSEDKGDDSRRQRHRFGEHGIYRHGEYGG